MLTLQTCIVCKCYRPYAHTADLFAYGHSFFTHSYTHLRATRLVRLNLFFNHEQSCIKLNWKLIVKQLATITTVKYCKMQMYQTNEICFNLIAIYAVKTELKELLFSVLFCFCFFCFLPFHFFFPLIVDIRIRIFALLILSFYVTTYMEKCLSLFLSQITEFISTEDKLDRCMENLNNYVTFIHCA